MPRIPYSTDLRDAEWAILEPLLPPSKSLVRPRADLRAVLNAIRYVTQRGAEWRMVPRDLVPWGTRAPSVGEHPRADARTAGPLGRRPGSCHEDTVRCIELFGRGAICL